MRLKVFLGVWLVLGFGTAVVRAQKWERLGPEGGMVVSLAAGVGGGMYLGTADGHVFASDNRAQSWELRGRVGGRLDAVITRIVVDPRNEKRILASVWYQAAGAGGGVFESDDRGQSWKLLGLGGEAVRALEIAPSQAEEIVAGTRSGVFRSVDGGKSWNRISPEGDEEIRNLDSVAIDPRDSNVIYAGTYHLPWLTRDGGKSWKPAIAGIIDDSDIMSLRLDATNPERVYMSACSGIYRSENQGGEWTKLQGIPYAARRTQVIVQDPANPKTLYAGTTAGLWVTRDGGESWARTTSKDWVVNSVVMLASANGAPSRVVLGTESGIQVSDDAGVTFAEANLGFTHVVVKQLVADESRAGHLLMVVERGTTELRESRDDGTSWSNLPLPAVVRGKMTTLGLAGFRKAVASPWGWMLRLDNGQCWIWDESRKSWKEWKVSLTTTTQLGAAGRKPGGAKMAVRALTPNGEIAFLQNAAVVTTSEGLVLCQQTGACTRLKGFVRNGKIGAIWASAKKAELGAVANGKLGLSTDGGSNVAWCDLPVSSEKVQWLDVADDGPDKTIWLGTSEGLFATASENSLWRKVTGGLPSGQTEQWLRRLGVLLISERDGGLYLSRDNGALWKRVDQDTERGRFTGLVGTTGGDVLAGSQSEGLLRFGSIGDQ